MKFVRLASVSIAILPLTLSAASTGTSSPAARAAAAAQDDTSDLTSLRAKAERGNAIAQYNLGLAHLQGRQTPVNLIEAYAWLTLAAEGGATGRALDTALDALTADQLNTARKRLETLRSSNSALRGAVAAAPAKPAPAAIPIIGETVTPARSTPTPIIAIPPADGAPVPTPRAREQASELEQQKRQLTAELANAQKEIEQLKSRLASGTSSAADLSALQAQLREAQTTVVRHSSELAAARIEQAGLQSQLTAAREAAATQSAAASQASEVTATLERERAAHAATRSDLNKLKEQVAALTATRDARERDTIERISSVEQGFKAATEEAKKRSAESTEWMRKADTLAAELKAARDELASTRQSLATTEEKHSTATSELAQVKKALEAATTRAASASSRADAAAQAEVQLSALRNQVSALERDLQTAKAAANRMTAEKASAEGSLVTANQKLTEATREISTLRQRVVDSGRQADAVAGQKMTALQSELNDTKSRLAAAERAATQRDAEIAKLRSSAAAVNARPMVSTSELDAVRRSANEAQEKLAAAERELTALRPQAAAAQELEQRVRELETKNAKLIVTSPVDPAANPEELARLREAQRELEAKLATSLRSYTLLAKERDDLQARVSELSARISTTSEALVTAEAQAKTVVDSASAAIAASAELETLRNRAAAAERSAETARAELARANQMLAAFRPNHAEPTRPTTQPAGEPARTHTIAPGETLSSISQRYYGTTARWHEILAANRDVLVDERSFAAGRTLRIP